MPSPTWSHEMSVVGLKFRWKRIGRQAIYNIAQRGDITGCRLEREPDNPADPNAIKVMLPNRMMEGKQLGYLMRESAELLAPRLDAGTLRVVSVRLTSLNERDDYNTGTVLVRFRDVRPKLRVVGKRPAKRRKAA